MTRPGDPEAASGAGFPGGFRWGVSTAAYQIEGAAAEDGRGPSIWDTFSRIPGRVRRGETGDIATDHYHRLEEDLDLIERLGVDVYRFSLAWSRLLPAGRGVTNPAGIAFYDRLIDGLLAKGVTPVPTLYHWDLPQALQDEGGWASRAVVDDFGAYAELVAERFGDRVPMWTTVNEPWVATYLGHALGVHAPGISDPATSAAAHHHMLLAHARATGPLRATGAEVGIALNMSHVRPAVDSEASRAAAALAFDQLAMSFVLPLRDGRYPEAIPGYSERWASGGELVRDGDLAAIRGTLDFLSLNEYHPRYVVAPEDLAQARAAGFTGSAEPAPFALGLPFLDLEPPGVRRTVTGWMIEPQGLADLLRVVGEALPGVPLYVSENGTTAVDYRGHDGRVQDPDRIDFLAGHIAACHDAIASGVDLRGYFVWSLLDNFEWSEGYAARFGIVYVDYPSRERTPKTSFDWYRGVIAANRPLRPEGASAEHPSVDLDAAPL